VEVVEVMDIVQDIIEVGIEDEDKLKAEAVLQERRRLLQGRRLSTEQQNELLEVFGLFADSDGWLAAKDLHDALRALGLRPTPAECDALLASSAPGDRPLRKLGFALFVDVVTKFMSDGPGGDMIVELLSPRGKSKEQLSLWQQVGQVLTKEQVVALIETFDMFDLDHTGSVPTADLQDLIVALRLRPADEQVLNALEEITVAGEDTVTFEQFVEGLLPCLALVEFGPTVQSAQTPPKGDSAMQPRHGLTAEQVERLATAFELFDLDRSGFVEFQELGEVLASLGISLDDAQYRVMQAMDKNDDAKIDLEEFLVASAPFVVAGGANALKGNSAFEYATPQTGVESAGAKLFDTADTHSKGALPPANLKRYLLANRAVIERLAGPHFNAPEFFAELSQFDGQEKMTKGMFVEYYAANHVPEDAIEVEIEADPMEAGLRELFDLFDMDGSGYVGAEEMGDVMRALGLPAEQVDVEQIMSQVDKSGDGQMSFVEFKLAMQRSQQQVLREEDQQLFSSGRRAMREKIVPPRRVLTDEQMYELSEAFDAFDIDGNGSITVDEMRLAMQNLGISASARQVRQIVSELDIDGDDCVSFDEFVTGVSPYMP